MACLVDFPSVSVQLDTAKKDSILPLHKLVFEYDGDRNNRKRLRSFKGFEFSEDDAQYKMKFDYIENNLTPSDLTTICLLLGLNHNVAEVEHHIIKNLCKATFLRDVTQADETDDEDGNADQENTENQQHDEGATNDRQSINDGGAHNTNTDNQQHGERATNVRQTINDSARFQANTNIQRHSETNDRRSMKSGRSSQAESISVYDDAVSTASVKYEKHPTFSLNFRDIEESVRPFDGGTSIPVELWVEEFEEAAILFQWSELQTLVFAKKSLQGLAKLFVSSEKGLNSWTKLKMALMKEFKSKVHSREIHKQLEERTMSKEETAMEYLYKMKKIASQGNIVEADLMNYVIDGIKDINVNKQMLYGARDLTEFKRKLQDYEECTKRKTSVFVKRAGEVKIVTQKKLRPESDTRCYNCGVKGHKSTNCKNKMKGTKCFKCNEYGHLARDCKKSSGDKREEVRCIAAEKYIMEKQVTVATQEVNALFDTGSMVNVVKASVYKKLDIGPLSKSNVSLSGFGQNNNMIKPIGQMETDVCIDNEIYNLTFCVVPDGFMRFDMIIGAPICKQAEIVINANGIRINKIEQSETMDIMNIEVHAETDTMYDIGTNISKTAEEEVRKLVNNYKPDKTKETNVSMKIVLTDETPIATTPRRLPLMERQIVEKQIEEWLKEGIIEESNSEFSSAIVLVTKKDGSKRLCVDYRRINRVIVRDRFPLPLIEDQLDRLQEAIMFSTIDLKNGFFHVPIDEESRKYTAFVTHNGQYQFRKVPFGLANSPAVFQRFVNTIFRELTQKGIAMPYVDDVIIPAKDENEAVSNLKQVLDLAKTYGLNLNIKKCHFMKKEIEFLGYHIENKMISPSRAKVETMLKYPVPKTLKQLESFIGLASYFRKFIPDFAKHAKPLTDLRKKDVKFVMGSEQISSFQMLKAKLAGSPVLKIFNQHHDTELHADASADGYGAVLLQRMPEDGKLHPCYYMSKKTSDAEKKYHSYELEILAVVEALKKFRVYLLGLKFKIVTDCNAFAKTMEKKDLCTRVARWLLLLQEYDYVIEHRSGAQMRHVDALSRYTVMMIGEETVLTKITKAQREDEDLKPIFKLLEQSEEYNGYYVKSNVLYKLRDEYELLVVPRSMQYEVIRRAHEKGHFAAKKTKDVLAKEYYISKIDEKIQRVISSCVECVVINRKRGKKEGELHPIPKHDAPLHTYHVDHLGPLESTHKMYKHVFVVIDAFTKFCWLYLTRSTTTKEVVDRLRLQSTTFGNPEVIISDRGTAFTSEEFQQYCSEEGIKHHVITTGLPRANGQVERLNSTIISVLAKMSVQDPAKWYKYVERVQKVINSTVHRSINTTPFELMIGKPMQQQDDLKIRQLIEEEMIRAYDEGREKLRHQAKEQIQKVQDENRHNYNLRRKAAPKYKVGDLIATKRTQFGAGLKLKAKYYGPYRVTAVKPNNTYDVTREEGAEGPKKTTTYAEFMKKWPENDYLETSE